MKTIVIPSSFAVNLAPIASRIPATTVSEPPQISKTLSSVFRSCDLDGDGFLTREDLIQTMLTHAKRYQLDISPEKAGFLTAAIFEAAGVDINNRLSQAILNQLIQNILPEAQYSPDENTTSGKQTKQNLWTRAGHLWSAYRKEFVYLALYVAVNIALFFIGAAVAHDEESSKRQTESINYTFLTAKGFGMIIDVNCGLIILPVLRYAVTFVRKTGIVRYIPLDALPKFHIVCAMFIVLAGIGHTLGHLVNFDDLSKKSLGKVTLEEYLFLPLDDVPGLIQGYASITGWLLLVILLFIVVFSLPVIRRSQHFQIFYWFHKLYLALWIVLIIHSRNFWKYFLLFVLIFFVEKIVKYYIASTRNSAAEILEASLLPSEAIHLVIKRPINFRYNPGDYIYIKIPAITSYEWHPFTISSAPEFEDYIWLHVRVVGNWTRALSVYLSQQKRKRFLPSGDFSIVHGHLQAQLKDTESVKILRTLSTTFVPSVITNHLPKTEILFPNQPTVKITPATPIPVFIDGPYGSSTAAIFHTEHAVLIGTGIGITPFASILGSIIQQFRRSRITCPHCIKEISPVKTEILINQRKLPLKKVDFIWICRDQKSIQWFLDLLKEWEQEHKRDGQNLTNTDSFVSVQIYITSGPKKSSLSAVGLSLGLDLHFKQTKTDMLTGLRSQTRTGRPRWKQVFSEINANRKDQVRVFFCGGKDVSREIRKQCAEYKFEFSWENF